jgi:acetoin utilization deacetylase AcuC-like enzyme
MRTLPVFFNSRMVAPSDSFSPSAKKPAQVVASWQKLSVSLDLREPTAATVAQFALAHDEQFVRDVLGCRQRNGFGNRSTAVAQSLPWTTGAIITAARHALDQGRVAVAPCSGFHHAGWASAAAYCTFNGLMVAAAVVHAEGATRVGILDCDHHYGDGTDEILDRLQARQWVHHFTAGKTYRRRAQAPEFFARLPAVLNECAGCDVVLYQAGADPHVDDPLGGWLTTAELRERDAVVFETLKTLQVPVAWNLAGGYQRDPDGGISRVIEIHDNTVRECARVFVDSGQTR